MSNLVFLGSKEAGLRLLARTIELIHFPHRIVGILCPDDSSDCRSVESRFRACAESNGIAFEVVRTAAQTERAIREWSCDVALICGWYSRIPLAHYSRTKFYGFHFSSLPKYRGNAPLVWQIIQGESQIGISFFNLSEELDGGDLIAQAHLPFGEDDTIADALAWASRCSIEMLTNHLDDLLDGTVVLKPQDGCGATYCGLRIPNDGRIDWNLPAKRIHDSIRSQTRPYDGAFSVLPDGRVVRIWRSAIETRTYHGVPGGVAECTSEMAVVTCGDGAIRVVEAQIDGTPHATVREILNSLRLRLH